LHIKKSASYAKCRLKSVAISWLHAKLNRVTSLPQSCCPSPLVGCYQAMSSSAMYLSGRCFIIWSGDSLY